MNRTLRKIITYLHSCLGLISGAVVSVVCLTGCLYCFRDEINNLAQPWKFVEPRTRPFLLPSEAITAARMTPGQTSSITYGQARDAIALTHFDRHESRTVYIHPCDGTLLRTVTTPRRAAGFFEFVLHGHRSLWLPPAIGRPIVGYSILTFIIIILTGLALRIPRRWRTKTILRFFTPRLTGNLLHLHQAAGTYTLLLLLLLAFTGLVRGMPWFSELTYRLTSGGQRLQPYTLPRSTLPATADRPPLAVTLDRLYEQLLADAPRRASLYLALPADSTAPIRATISHRHGMYYTWVDNLFFDRYTLQPLTGTGPYAGRYADLPSADRFRRMNLDIHDGRILGLPGKILAFLVSLAGASLPLTGLLLHLKKRRRKHPRTATP
jgi:uncharacterized iron-regulated membrane protein